MHVTTGEPRLDQSPQDGGGRGVWAAPGGGSGAGTSPSGGTKPSPAVYKHVHIKQDYYIDKTREIIKTTVK